MYRVVKPFVDLSDGYYPYSVGDTFPRKGMTADKARLAELASTKNRQGMALIEEVKEAKKETKKKKA